MIHRDEMTEEQRAWLSGLQPGAEDVRLTPLDSDEPKRVFAIPVSTNPRPWIVFEDRSLAYVDEVKEWPGGTPLRQFGAAIEVPVQWQGGTIFLHYYGCGNCGNAFWTEGDAKRRLAPGEHHCPHCGVKSLVPKADS